MKKMGARVHRGAACQAAADCQSAKPRDRRRMAAVSNRRASYVLHLLWGGQSCPQPPFRRLFPDVSGSSRGKGRLKAGCSQDWLPHNLGGIVSRIKKCAALGQDPAPGIPSVCPKIMNATLIPVYQADGS